jgi:hypothetical protein
MAIDFTNTGQAKGRPAQKGFIDCYAFLDANGPFQEGNAQLAAQFLNNAQADSAQDGVAGRRNHAALLDNEKIGGRGFGDVAG